MRNKPIRILHVIGVMHHGGAETMIMNFYRHIDRSKVQFDFVENDDKYADFDDEIRSLGGRIYHCPHYNGKNHFKYVAWWKNFLAQHAGEYKAVHGHVGSTAAIYLRLSKQTGLYTIAHSHGVTSHSLRDLLYRVYSYPTRFIADQFFGCSVAAGESRYGKRVCSNTNKFKVLNNAIETDRFAFDSQIREQMRHRLGISNNFVIGHIGRFEEVKNHAFLIQIFKEIHDRNPDAVLLLLGKGELQDQVMAQTVQNGLKECVIFAGVHNDVSPYYQAMDVFVLPSLSEGKPFVIIEAQASGLPCVISDAVPDECVLSEELCSIRRLIDPADVWAEHILSCANTRYADCSKIVKQSGYDIADSAKWLEEFYLKTGEQK